MRSIFLEHFIVHKDSIQIFTDGSKSIEGVGYAAIFPQKVIKRHISSDASIYTAELMAILTSLKEILIQRGKSYVIVSDSQSALTAIKSFNPDHSIIIEIQETLSDIYRSKKSVRFCWVPSHVGVKENERADQAAKSAVNEAQIRNITLPYKDMYSTIERQIKDKVQRKWTSESTRNKLRKIKTNITPWSSSLHKNRHWEVVLARLRLGHTRLTHRYLMEHDQPPVCEVCNSNLTVEHILIFCEKYKNQRKTIFKDFYLNGNRPNLKSLLEESNIFSIRTIMKFLRETDLLDKV